MEFGGFSGVDCKKLELPDILNISDKLAAGFVRPKPCLPNVVLASGFGTVFKSGGGTELVLLSTCGPEIVSLSGSGKGTVPVLFPSFSAILSFVAGVAPCLLFTQ